MTKYTAEQVAVAMSKACEDIIKEAPLPETGTRDALNLLVNAGVSYLTGEASDLAEVADLNYPMAKKEAERDEAAVRTLDVIFDWILSGTT